MAKRLLPGVLYERITAGTTSAARRLVSRTEHTGNGRFAPNGPQIPRPKQRMNPFVVLGGALATGIVLAKLIDWRAHAHPRS